MKHPDGQREDLTEAVCAFVRSSVRLVDAATALEIHALSVHWTTQGMVPATAVFPTAVLVMHTWTTYACEHATCGARFVAKHTRDAHMDMHFDEAVWSLQHCATVQTDGAAKDGTAIAFVNPFATPMSSSSSSAPSHSHSWLVDDTGKMVPVPWVGFFVEHRRRQKVHAVAAAAGTTLRASSPVPTRLCNGIKTCGVCGDSLPPSCFIDAVKEWCVEGCVALPLKAGGGVVHVACRP